jgi:GntR family transcriptional regulator, transcriptional repressor for pyruvate dehydrogenase complex
LVVPIIAGLPGGLFESETDPRASAVDTCTRVLRGAIVSRQLPPGLRLPPERELAERFGVNRVTVRTALARLEAEHLLSVRQGSGYAVRDYARSGGPDLIATLASLAGTAKDRAVIVRDLLAVRRQLARTTLERLVDGAGEAAMREVDLAIDRLEAAAHASAPVAELATADLEIVAALVAATGSAVLQLCFNPVATLLRELPLLQEAMYRDPHSNVSAFRAVVELVRKRNLAGVEVAIGLLEARDEATVTALARGREAPRRGKRK